MSLEADASISKNEFHSWTVEQGTKFADRFSKIESNVDKVITGLAMLLVGAVAFPALLLADAIRGTSHILESAYNWEDRDVEVRSPVGMIEPSPVPVEKAPGEKILEKAGALKALVSVGSQISLDTASKAKEMRKELASEILEHIQNMEHDEALQFVGSVFVEMGSAVNPNYFEKLLLGSVSEAVNFSIYFTEKSQEIRDEFVANFAEDPFKATNQLLKMNDVLIFVTGKKVNLLSAADESLVRREVQSKLLADLNALSDLDRVVNALQEIGLPPINTTEILNKIVFLKSSIEDLNKENEKLGEAFQVIRSYLGEVHGIEARSLEIKIEIERATKEIRLLESLPKEVDPAAYGKISQEDSEAPKKFEAMYRDVQALYEHPERIRVLKAQVVGLNDQIQELELKKGNLLKGQSVDFLTQQLSEIESKIFQNEEQIKSFRSALDGDLNSVVIPGEEDVVGAGISDSPSVTPKRVDEAVSAPPSLLSSSLSNSYDEEFIEDTLTSSVGESTDEESDSEIDDEEDFELETQSSSLSASSDKTVVLEDSDPEPKPPLLKAFKPGTVKLMYNAAEVEKYKVDHAAWEERQRQKNQGLFSWIW